MAQADEPEMWETNENGVKHLVSGGKHYGHLEMMIQPYTGNPLDTGATPAAELVMTPIAMFPILDDNLDFVEVERREMSGQQSVYLNATGQPMAGTPTDDPADPDPTEPVDPDPTEPVDPDPTEPVGPVPSGNAFALVNTWDSTTHDKAFAYGRHGDEVLVGDWDGNGTDTLAVRRGTTFYLNNTLTGGHADTEFAYGRHGDQAFAGDFNATGQDTISLRRGNVFHINNALAGGPSETTIAYGRATDHLFIGDWDGNGTDTPGVNRDSVWVEFRPFFLSPC